MTHGHTYIKKVILYILQVTLEWIRLDEDDVLGDCELLGHFINTKTTFGFLKSGSTFCEVKRESEQEVERDFLTH